MRADALGKLSGVNVNRVLGNHGAESEDSQESHRQIEKWKSILELELGGLQGVWIEDKGFSLAVHYRQSTRKTEARRRIFAAARKLSDVRFYGGKLVVNLTPEQAPNKGDALATERDRLQCAWVLYLGDDDNDEDAFALSGNVVPVRIGRKQHSHARYYLRSQLEIDELLELLVRLRAAR